MKCNKCGAVQQTSSLNASCMICGSILESSKTETISIPWEDIENIGLLKAFAATFKQIILKPSSIFNKVSEKTNLFTAVMFALLATAIGTLGDLIWKHVFSETELYSALQTSDISSQTIAYTPIILLVGLLLSTTYIYLLTTLFKCRKYSFKTLLSGVCYTHAVSVLTVIPFLGLIIMPVWSLIVTIIMVARMSRISVMRALMVLILPALILFILIIFPMMIFMGGVLFSIGTILKFYQ